VESCGSSTEGHNHPRVPRADEVDTFWDWSFLEPLVQSELRTEEASELTTLDILKRRMPDGGIYKIAKPAFN
jgi:hypothetical protein